MFDHLTGPPPSSRREAKSLGLPAFRCPLPCPKCQSFWRRVSTGQCVDCAKASKSKTYEEQLRASRRATAPARAVATRRRNLARKAKEAEALKLKEAREALREQARKDRAKARRQAAKAAEVVQRPQPTPPGDPQSLPPWELTTHEPSTLEPSAFELEELGDDIAPWD